MLNILYGENVHACDEYAEKIIKQNAENNVLSYVLVPEQFSLSAEKHFLKAFGVKAQAHIKVITFSRLCNMIVSKLGPLRLKYVDGAGKQIIAAKTIRALSKKAGSLSAAMKKRGFSSVVVDLVSEFKRYGVTPEKLLSASEEIEDLDLSQKLKDLYTLYLTYDKFLNEHLSDAEDNLLMLYPKIPKCDFLNGCLFIRQFRSFTPVELSAIGELMKKQDVYVSLCCDSLEKSSYLYSITADTAKGLKELAEKLNIDFDATRIFPEEESVSEVSYLQKNYFANRPRPWDKAPDCIKVFETINKYREIEGAADYILRTCREENRKFSDFLILSGDTDSYKRIMPAIFESRGINVFLDSKRSLLSNPLCDMLCSALDILANGVSSERVIKLIKSGLCDISLPECDIFENYILAVNPSYAMWDSKDWSFCPSGYNIGEIMSIRDRSLAFYTCLKSKIQGKSTSKELCDALLSALSDCKVSDKIEDICKTFTDSDMGYLADEYRQVWNTVISVVSQISTLMDDEPISRADFFDLFRSACSGISVGVSPQYQDSVFFSSVDSFRSDGSPVVIILGATDGVFPKSHSSEGLISDSEREYLNDKGLRLAPGGEYRQREGQLLINSVLSVACEKLVFFYAAFDDGGSPLNPSPVITRIKNKLFPYLETKKLDDFPLCGAEGKSALFEYLAVALANAKGNKDALTHSEKVLFDRFSQDEEYKNILFDLVEKIHNPRPEKLSEKAIDAIYEKPLSLSASRLERFNSCPFSYFLSYGLDASEREISSIEPRSMGNIQHETLYRYFSELKDSDADYSQITEDECFEKIRETVDIVAREENEALYESSHYYKYIISRMQAICGRTAWEVIRFYQSGEFRPIGYELSVGKNGDFPAFDVKDEKGEVVAHIRGYIDRADIAYVDGKPYISVVDYKSSEKRLDPGCVEDGVTIQPLLYSDILCKEMGASPGAMLYMHMTDPLVKLKTTQDAVTEEAIEKERRKDLKYTGWIADNPQVKSKFTSDKNLKLPTSVDEDTLKEQLSATEEKIRETVDEISNGNIKPMPCSSSTVPPCTYCIFKSSCDYEKS